jgi:hypothetical protein
MKEKITTLSAYLDHLRMDGRYWLSRKEAMEVLQIGDKAFKLSAHRLSVKLSLKRIRGDFLIIVSPEITAFDLVKYMNDAGQINHVATVLSELVEQLDAKKLAELLKKDNVVITTAQHLIIYLIYYNRRLTCCHWKAN